MPKYLPAGLTQYVLNNFSKKSPRHNTSFKTTFRCPSNGWGWSRSPVISRYGDEVATSRCNTRHVGRDYQNLPGSGKWTSSFPAPTSCVIGPGPRTSTAESTASIAECGSGGTARALLQQRGTFPTAGLRLCSPRRLANTTRYLLREPTFVTRETTGYGGLEKSA